ncbi:hypothetical protein [Leptospira adleri]|uniref:hypothetical protein n=1 Tax=Leptospira adleri TaxID=2023186 RepID=UPI001082A067|nr:hypothetical protein [Leptospira adleri]TGM60879.1 hypothetical protein EHQ97_02065 [Leptospira adleri]
MLYWRYGVLGFTAVSQGRCFENVLLDGRILRDLCRPVNGGAEDQANVKLVISKLGKKPRLDELRINSNNTKYVGVGAFSQIGRNYDKYTL